MNIHGSGNGSGKFHTGKFVVHQQDMGGWVRVFPDAKAVLPEEAAGFLSLALTEWFRQRPHLRMRNVIAITRNGTTAELHAWYELGVFPDLTGHHPQPGQNPG